MGIIEAWTAVSRAKSLARAASPATFKILAFNNDDPKASVWTKTADEIIVSAARLCRRISNPGHKQYIDKYGEDMPQNRNRSNPK